MAEWPTDLRFPWETATWKTVLGVVPRIHLKDRALILTDMEFECIYRDD